MTITGIKRNNNMVITGIKCKNCGEIIFSRASHDMRFCSCKTVAVDGGQATECFNVTFTKSPEDFVMVKFNSSLTKQQLYDDYNNRIDKYGVITKDEQETIDILEVRPKTNPEPEPKVDVKPVNNIQEVTELQGFLKELGKIEDKFSNNPDIEKKIRNIRFEIRSLMGMISTKYDPIFND